MNSAYVYFAQFLLFLCLSLNVKSKDDKFYCPAFSQNPEETEYWYTKIAADNNDHMDKLTSKITNITQTLKKLNARIQNCECKYEPQNEKLPQSCLELKKEKRSSSIYQIQPNLSPEPFIVYCDMEAHDGGWTYFLNRYDGSEDFFLGWSNYKEGFGRFIGEFWLGLQNLFYITNSDQCELLVELVDWDNIKAYAHYAHFRIGDETDGYFLEIDGFSGTAGDALKIGNQMKFSTKDKDQDRWRSNSCAETNKGAWWYRRCMQSQLTGPYKKGWVKKPENYVYSDLMYWGMFRPNNYSLKEARMMVRVKH